MSGRDPLVAFGRELARLSATWDALDEAGIATRRGSPELECRVERVSRRINAVEAVIAATRAGSAEGALIQTALACSLTRMLADETDDGNAARPGGEIASLLYSVASALERLSDKTLEELGQERLMPREDDPFEQAARERAA
ncbi:MAG: hypothetical protein ACHQF3_00160 [Alphaproteobacteria bacterium]